MGPRLFRRGNDSYGHRFYRMGKASMGPRLFRRGNIRGVSQSRAINRASMGPRLFRRGNGKQPRRSSAPTFSFNGATSFQTWKYHRLAVCRFRPSIASMGPRLFRRGNGICDGGERMNYCDASMGPRLFRRGNHSFSGQRKPLQQLQWGHVFSDVEIWEGGSLANHCQ